MFGAVEVEPCSPKKGIREGWRYDWGGYQSGEKSTHLDNCLQALNIGPLSFQQPLGNKLSSLILKNSRWNEGQ